MSELERIHVVLNRTARRRRWLNGWKGLAQGVFLGGMVWLLTLATFKLLPIPPETLSMALGLAGLCAVTGLVVGLWRHPSLAETARWVDERRQLKERLSTAWEISQSTVSDAAPVRAVGGTGEAWRRLVVTDAARHAEEVDPRVLVPLGMPGMLRWGLLVAVLGAGLGFVPEYRTEAHREKEQDAANVQDVGRQMAELIRRNIQQTPALTPPTEQAMSSLADLGDLMSEAKLTRNDALRDLSDASEKFRQDAKSLLDDPVLKRLERAAREGRGGAPSPGEMQRQMEAMKQAMGGKDAAPEKLAELEKKLNEMKQAAAGMPDKNSPGAEAAREQLAQALSQLAQEASAMGVPMPDLESAIDALKNNAPGNVHKDLEAAMHDLEKLQAMGQAMRQLQEQMAELGKDLAEQLAKGQAQAAQQTLQKMIDQLKSAEMAPDQMNRIMQEVAKALDPAGDYGEVAKHLQKAVEQMQTNEKPGAAQSLAEAKKALEDLMDKMQDADALMASLEALERAQMALSKRKSWEQCKAGECGQCSGEGCAMCDGQGKKLGWRHGGKPGYGVGTWADEDGGWSYMPRQQVPMDHSGIERPDMEGRARADRPEDLNPDLAPTQLKGQLSPGQSMPSITLKGLHIKGSSNVKYEEAVAAAQAEAQSALNQDRVPRPYLNSVRTYFDDLKE